VVGRLKTKLGIKEDKTHGLVEKVVSKIRRRRGGSGIKVRGVSDMLVRFANCCHPIPGEKVVGFITRGRGITIHQKNCRHILHADPDRLVEISWDTGQEETHIARLKVTSLDQKGILADLSAVLTQKNANIVQADVKTTIDKKGIALFTLEVENFQQLQDIIAGLKRVKNVLKVERQ